MAEVKLGIHINDCSSTSVAPLISLTCGVDKLSWNPYTTNSFNVRPTMNSAMLLSEWQRFCTPASDSIPFWMLVYSALSIIQSGYRPQHEKELPCQLHEISAKSWLVRRYSAFLLVFPILWAQILHVPQSADPRVLAWYSLVSRMLTFFRSRVWAPSQETFKHHENHDMNKIKSPEVTNSSDEVVAKYNSFANFFRDIFLRIMGSCWNKIASTDACD